MEQRTEQIDGILGKIEVIRQNHSRIVAGGKTIHIDPFRFDSEPKDADFILITHDHHDHFSPADIERVANAKTVLVVPENMLAKAAAVEKIVAKTVAVKPGEKYVVDGLEFETVPAYNVLKPFHPLLAGWVGYVINADGVRIYVAGDTDATREAKAVRCDVALLPVGGKYTMNAKQAAGLANLIRPKAAIPVHYGSVVGSEEDGLEFERLVDPAIKVVFKIPFGKKD